MLSSFALTISSTSFFKTMFSQFKHRSRIGIVVDIMDTVMRSHPQGSTKTQIMRGARLSYEQTNRYLDLLMQYDFIRGEKINCGDHDLIRYTFSRNGFELFKQLHTLRLVNELFVRKFGLT